MNRRTFLKFLLGTVASIAVNPIDALSRPAQPMPIPRQPVPEPVTLDPIIEVSNYGRSIEITETFNNDFLEFIDCEAIEQLKRQMAESVSYYAEHVFTPAFSPYTDESGKAIIYTTKP